MYRTCLRIRSGRLLEVKGGFMSTKRRIDNSGENSDIPGKKTRIGRRHVKVKYEDHIPSHNTQTKRNETNVVAWKPQNWETIVENIQQMRKNRDAPVDSMGCDKCSDGNQKPEVFRFQILVSLMLSSQTKDAVTYATIQKLREHGLTVDNIIKADNEVIGDLIRQVGFWKTKVKYLKKTAVILKDKYECDIPKTVEELLRLPGVGPKMAHLCMKSAWNEVTGIGVDTHVHRIANRLQWVGKNGSGTKTPEKTRVSLESWLPRPLWDKLNHLLVGFGQTICRPTNPLCSICLNQSVCPYRRNDKKEERTTQ